jgi:hypothetical protein
MGRSRRFPIWLAAVCVAAAAPASADHLDELILFDQTGAEQKLDEGLVRQRLGLLNADGRPALPLVPLVSADGKRAAYDMDGTPTNPSFDGRLVELKGDGGTLVLLTHGNTGIITMERQLVKGFGAGTGSNDACAQPALPVTRVLRNLTIRMAVCLAARTGNQVTAVSQSLRDAIVAAGGSITALSATADTVDVLVSQRVRIRDGYTPTEAEVRAVVDTVNAFSVGRRPFASQYVDYQGAINAKAPPDSLGTKIFAVLEYSTEPIDGFVLRRTPSTHPGPLLGSLEDLEVIIHDGECLENCGPVSVESASWGRVKALYR